MEAVGFNDGKSIATNDLRRVATPDISIVATRRGQSGRLAKEVAILSLFW
jgi:hypothetical protein